MECITVGFADHNLTSLHHITSHHITSQQQQQQQQHSLSPKKGSQKIIQEFVAHPDARGFATKFVGVKKQLALQKWWPGLLMCRFDQLNSMTKTPTENGPTNQTTTWLVDPNQPNLKKYVRQKMGGKSSPKVWDEHKKCLSCHQLELRCSHILFRWFP